MVLCLLTDANVANNFHLSMTPEESSALDDYLQKYDPAGVTYLNFQLRELTHEQLCKAMMDMAEWGRVDRECTAMEKSYQQTLRSFLP